MSSTAQQTPRSVADAILAAVRRRRPQARALARARTFLSSCSAQIRAEAASAERKSYAGARLFARALARR